MIAKRYLFDEAPRDAISLLQPNSLFGSISFMNLWRSVKGTPVLFALSEGEAQIGCLPGIEFGARPLRRFQAMPDGLYATPTVTPLYIDRADEVYAELIQAVAASGYIKAHVCDFHGRFTDHSGFKVSEFVTTVLDIENESWEPSDVKIRKEIRKAEREGINTRPFDYDRDFGRFIDLMRRVEKRHGRAPKYPPAFYDALAQLANDEERVDWVWCEHDGKAAASHIYLIEDDLILGWQAFFDEEFSFLKPSQFMLFETVQSWAGKGIKRLNLGVSPTNEPTVEAYKRKWGGAPYHYHHLIHSSLIGRLL